MKNLTGIEVISTNYHSKGLVYNVKCDKGETFIKNTFKQANPTRKYKVICLEGLQKGATSNDYKVFETL